MHAPRAAPLHYRVRFQLKNVRTEGFEFGRGWSIAKSSVRLLKPRIAEYRAIPVAWTPATNGAISAPIIVAPMSKADDFERWRGKLRGQIVLVTQPDTGSEPAELAALSNNKTNNTYGGPVNGSPFLLRGFFRCP